MTSQPSYFALSSKDRIDALEAAASTLGRPADLLEKDIWVVWVLDALFSSRIGEHLVFKGGTSLSKAYKAIDRFSEDVDLTYDIRQIIPDLIEDPDNPYPPNRSQAKKWTETVRARLSDWVKAEPFDILFEKIKATAIHAYCLRGTFRGGDRYARHWYDLDCLDRAGIATKAINDRNLAADVARHKQHFFRENDQAGKLIDYRDAVKASLCLIPTGEALESLRQDYQQMSDAGLLQSDATKFDELIDRLTDLENRANAYHSG